MYIYHLKPKEMQGETLYPLNTLKDRLPQTYIAGKLKYEGREEIMHKRLLCLDCLWNDVLHFSPISPQLALEAYVESGGEMSRPFQWYKISASSVSHLPSAWYISPPRKLDGVVDEKYCKLMDWKAYEELTEVPEETKSYYKEMLSSGRSPLLYVGVPHVLIKAPVDISDCEIQNFDPQRKT